MKRILLILGAGLLSLMHPAAAQATLLDFTFSFTGTVPPGDVAGTVTGEIFGLTEGATSSATNVIVDSYPAGLGLPSPPQTVFSNRAANTFTVSSTDELTAATYDATDSADLLTLSLNRNDRNFVINEFNLITENGDGFTGATYTLAAPVPAPVAGAGIPGLLAGLGAFLFW